MEHLKELHIKNRLSALPAHIILGWKWLAATKTLASYDKELIPIKKE